MVPEVPGFRRFRGSGARAEFVSLSENLEPRNPGTPEPRNLGTYLIVIVTVAGALVAPPAVTV